MKGMTLTFSGIVIDSTDPCRRGGLLAAGPRLVRPSGPESAAKSSSHAQQGETVYGPPSIVFQPVPRRGP